MKKHILMLSFGLAATFAQAQDVDPPTREDSLRKLSPLTDADRARTYVIVEQMPEFPGGDGERRKYFSQNVRPPEEVKNGTVLGTVFVAFIIDEQGNIFEPTLVKGLSKACDEEALRLISQMPRWKPGKQNGKAVFIKYVLPVAFSQKTK